MPMEWILVFLVLHHRGQNVFSLVDEIVKNGGKRKSESAYIVFFVFLRILFLLVLEGELFGVLMLAVVGDDGTRRRHTNCRILLE